MTQPLYREAGEAAALLSDLRSMGETEEEALEVAVEGETNLPEAVARGLAQASLAELEAQAITELCRRLVARRERLSHRADRIRRRIASTLQGLGLKRLSTAAGTVSVSAGQPAVVVLDEGAVPSKWWRERLMRQLDKAAIKEALQQGEQVPGCTLDNRPETIRVTL